MRTFPPSPIKKKEIPVVAGNLIRQTVLSKIQIERELGKRSLYEFLKLSWPQFDPAPFIDNWHISLICEYLERCYRREIRNLVINIPPRHCKSSIVSVAFPVWVWINNPKERFFTFSYAYSLCERDAIKSRTLIRSDWFKERWGDIVCLDNTNRDKVRDYENTKKGYRKIATVSGAVTGEGADWLIVDDPLNAVDAESQAIRHKTNIWWNESVGTRANNPKTVVKLCIMQRLHEEDLAGDLISKGYTYLVLPAYFEHDHPHRSVDDPRTKDGEILWPQRWNEAGLKELGLSPYAEAGQLQQRPSPRKGGMFDRDWFKNSIIPFEAVPSGGVTVRGWDIAAGKEYDSAWTAGVKMKRVGDKYYILHVTRFRAIAGRLASNIQATVEADDLEVRFQSIPQDPGAAGKQLAYNWKDLLKGYPVRTSLESGDKVNRAQAYASDWQLENIYLVEGSWNKAFIDEHCVFPRGKYLDQVDAASRAYQELRNIFRQGDVSRAAKTPEILAGDMPSYLLQGAAGSLPAPAGELEPIIAGPRWIS
jgi:predicted phage terminase large subunit-like protein